MLIPVDWQIELVPQPPLLTRQELVLDVVRVVLVVVVEVVVVEVLVNVTVVAVEVVAIVVDVAVVVVDIVVDIVVFVALVTSVLEMVVVIVVVAIVDDVEKETVVELIGIFEIDALILLTDTVVVVITGSHRRPNADIPTGCVPANIEQSA